MYTLDETNKKLKRILNLLDWSKGFDVSSVSQRHLPAILQIIEKKRLPVVHSFMLNFHYLPKDEALKFDTTWVDWLLYNFQTFPNCSRLTQNTRRNLLEAIGAGAGRED